MSHKNLFLACVLITIAISASSCSTAKVRVMPGENGVNQVLVRDIERDNAEVAAVDAANKYCKDEGKKAVFLNNKTQYTGSMDESTRKTVRNASKAAMILRGGATGAGDDVASSVLGTAGTTGYSMTSDRDYQTEVQFKCQ